MKTKNLHLGYKLLTKKENASTGSLKYSKSIFYNTNEQSVYSFYKPMLMAIKMKK